MSKFQQRHYEAIAEVMQKVVSVLTLEGYKGPNASEQWVIDTAVGELADYFENDNRMFQRGRFERACQPGANVKARVR